MVTAAPPTDTRPILVTGPQHDFTSATERIRGICAGRGSGKSVIGAADQIMKAKADEPYMVVSPNYVVLEDTTWPTFREVAESLGVWINGVKSPVPRAWCRTQDGGVANWIFRSGDKPESLRGPSKAGIWIDEPSIQKHDVFKFALPCLRHRGVMGDLTLTFTPKGKKHWTYGVFYTKDVDGNEIPMPGTRLISAHTLSNPFLPPEYYDTVRGHYSARLAAQELAGEFVEIQGLLFDNFSYVDAAPYCQDMVRYWDKAATPEGEGDGDWSVGLLMGRASNGNFYVLDLIRGRWSYEQRNKIILEAAHRDKERYENRVRIYLEQEGGSGGKESMQISLKQLAGYPAYRDNVSQGKQWKVDQNQKLPGEAKVTRAQPLAAQLEAGNVYAIRAPWNADWEEELRAFPESTYADQVDASSGAFNKLAMSAFSSTMEPPTRIARPRANAAEKWLIQAVVRKGRNNSYPRGR